MKILTKILFIFNVIFAFSVLGQIKVEAKKITCDKSMQSFIEMARNNYNSIQLKEKVLSIQLNLIANCEMNFSFLSHVSVNHDTLMLDYFNEYIHESNGDSLYPIKEQVISSCDCYFNTELHVKEIEKVPTIILLGKWGFAYSENGVLVPEKSYQELFYSDCHGLPTIPKKLTENSTKLNRVDSYGNNIGIWITEKDNIKIYSHFRSIGKLKTENDWRIIIHPEDQKRIEVLSESGNWYLPSSTELKALRSKVKLIKRQKSKSNSI